LRTVADFSKKIVKEAPQKEKKNLSFFFNKTAAETNRQEALISTKNQTGNHSNPSDADTE
jgi:hypothetical protein